MSQRIVSPCVGLCSTTVGDNVCRGCQRHDGEILRWPSFSTEQREQRMRELDQMRSDAASRFVEVVDAGQLEQQLLRHRIRFRQEQPALSRVVELLRVGRQQIKEVGRYGIFPVTGSPTDPQALYAAINQVLLDAGEARRCRDIESSHSSAECSGQPLA
uniref:DUF1289 domain-containing protein n=1 Tax=Halomonas sp. TaxID=1486246 RepID=UPI00260B8048|nr:DUF1289 domain-containing protein [Halomonas sp.]